MFNNNTNGYTAIPVEDDTQSEKNDNNKVIERENNNRQSRLKTAQRPTTINIECCKTNFEYTKLFDTMTPMMTSSGNSGNSEPYKAWQRAENKQTRLNTHLLNSIQNGELELVKKFLSMGANPNATCRHNRISAVNLAALMGFKDILTELLARGACINFEDIYGQNILHYVAFAENVECLEEIICYAKEKSRGFNIISTIINQSANDREQPQLLKIFSDNLEHNCNETKYFIPVLDRGSTPLHVACQQANDEICKILTENGASFNIVDSRNCFPMNVVGEAFLNTGDDELQTELTCFYKTICFCISQNAKFNECLEFLSGTELISPIHTAIELEHVDSVKLLLNYEANPGAFDSSGETAIHIAISKKNEDIAKLLIEAWIRNHDNINIKNVCGYTPFQMAVDLQWIPGIYILLEAGADVTETAHNGDSVLHIASASGNLNLVQELLDFEDTKKVLELRNKCDETPLFCAVKSGSLECVKALLNAGANVYAELSDNLTLLHRTAELGFCEILYELVNMAKEKGTQDWFDKRDTSETSGRTALHIAASRDQLACVKSLLDAGCDIRIKTTEKVYANSTALHLAAQYGRHRIVELLLEYDHKIIDDTNASGWKALHLAAYNGHRQCVQVLLKRGADLSECVIVTCGNQPHCTLWQSATDMIMNCISRPTEFMEKVFDSCVTKNEYNVRDTNCTIDVSHEILMPSDCPRKVMKVLKSILNTGNRYGQKRLLLHPVVESFLYLKWKALCPFFYAIFVLYIIYVFSLTTIALSLYFFAKPDDEQNLFIIKTVVMISSYAAIVSLAFIVLQEILHAKQNLSKYLGALETWLKWTSFTLSGIIVVREIVGLSREDWLRHICAITILLAWIELMFLFSRFPVWGYYVLMFFKVAKNVLKVLLTFCFLIIGFSYSFLIEFRTAPPFSNPLEAMVKTFVMMTSEYDYMDLFENSNEDDPAWTPTKVIGRIVFMAFVVLVSIVLMNLMVGLAVSDISVLEIKGQIQRLEKQVDFLSALSFLTYINMEPSENNIIKNTVKKELNSWVPIQKKNLVFYPGKPSQNRYSSQAVPLEILESLTDIAALKEQEDEITITMLSEKLELMQKILVRKLENLEKQTEKIKPQAQIIEKPKKKLLRHLQNIVKRNEARSTNLSVNDLTDKGPTNLNTLSLQRLDNIEKNVKSFEELLKKVCDKLNIE